MRSIAVVNITAPADAATTYEAEAADLRGVSISKSTRASGGAFVTGLDGDGDSVSFRVKVSQDGYYPVSVRYSAAGDKYNDIAVNGQRSNSVFFPLSKSFNDVFACNALLTRGENTISILKGWGWTDIDALKLGAPIPRPALSAVDATPVLPNASAETRALYQYLASVYGKRVLSGQQGAGAEMEYVREVSGRLPAIAGFDMLTAGDEYTALDWAAVGGIVQFQWHWRAPAGEADFYADKTKFDVRRAVTPGTEEYAAVLSDIDDVAARLKVLADAKVPVLWRPLHEAQGAWFWWGAKGAVPCMKLYAMMWDRLVNYHRLDNLIWVWTSGTSPKATEWYPGNAYVDIVGLDAYPPAGEYAPFSGEFDALFKLCEGRKMVAYTENGPIPDPGILQRDKVRWLYFSTWSGDFILDGKTNSPEQVKKVYNSNYVITLDELPSERIYGRKPIAQDEALQTPEGTGDVVDISDGPDPLSATDGAVETTAVEPAPIPEGYAAYEAEKGRLQGGCRVEGSLPGFPGTGYVTGFEAAGAALELDVSVQKAGKYSLLVRHTLHQTALVSINGASLGDTTFPEMSLYEDADLGTITLRAGKNIIRIQRASNAFDVDCVMLRAIPASSKTK